MCFCYDTATAEIYPLSLHDALPISSVPTRTFSGAMVARQPPVGCRSHARRVALVAAGLDDVTVTSWPVAAGGSATDRKSTRLNSSHSSNSYAVFFLKTIKPLSQDHS